MPKPLVKVEPGDSWESFCKRNNHHVNDTSLREWDNIDSDVYNKIFVLREEWGIVQKSIKDTQDGLKRKESVISSGLPEISTEDKLVKYALYELYPGRNIGVDITPEIALGMVIGCIEGYRELGKGSE